MYRWRQSGDESVFVVTNTAGANLDWYSPKRKRGGAFLNERAERVSREVS